MCLDDQKRAGTNGHISQVASFSETTGTGTLNLHLSMKHNLRGDNAEKVSTILGYIQKYNKSEANTSTTTSMTTHEFNRDLVIWFCRDLLPFEAVVKEGMNGFFQKVFPTMSLPTAATLSSTALDDVYQAVFTVVKDMIQNVNSMCLMFDGWTDRHLAYPYRGVRASFIKDWNFNVVTLGCHD